jgi:hypothetical protein
MTFRSDFGVPLCRCDATGVTPKTPVVIRFVRLCRLCRLSAAHTAGGECSKPRGGASGYYTPSYQYQSSKRHKRHTVTNRTDKGFLACRLGLQAARTVHSFVGSAWCRCAPIGLCCLSATGFAKAKSAAVLACGRMSDKADAASPGTRAAIRLLTPPAGLPTNGPTNIVCAEVAR